MAAYEPWRVRRRCAPQRARSCRICQVHLVPFWAPDQGVPGCAQGVMRVAWLQDGSAWALVQAPVLRALADAQLPDMPARHAALLDAYAAGRPSLAGVPDDGYIMQVPG